MSSAVRNIESKKQTLFLIENHALSGELETARQRIIKLVNFLSEHYFRTRVIHKETRLKEINERTNIVFAANHSGMCFPWDSFILYQTLFDYLGEKRKLLALQTPALTSSRLMSPFGLDKFWDHFCTPATTKNFELEAQKKNNIFIHPEGVAGIGKGFNNKYKMQKFSSSMIRICLQHNLPLVPVYIVNGEYLNPFAYKFDVLNKLVQRFSIPFLPLSPMVFPLLLFPFVFYMTLPANLHYVVDHAIDLKDYTDKKYEDLSVAEIRKITKQVQARMQQGLDESVLKYGQNPYNWSGFFSHVKQLGLRSIKLFPWTWTFQFHQAANYRSNFYLSLKNALIKISLSVPIIGWPLFLICLLVFPLPKEQTYKA